MASRPRPHVQVRRLTDLTLPQLRTLLAAERRAWRDRLHWDLGDASDLLEQAVHGGILPGAAVTVDGRAVASITHVAVGNVFRLCGLHLGPQAPPAAARLLVDAALDAPEVVGRRVEGQLFAFGQQQLLDEALARGGLDVVRREYMALNLTRPLRFVPDGPRPLRGPRRLCSADLTDCARVLAAAHAGGVEAALNVAFRSESQALAYLAEVCAGPGCGNLHAEASSAIDGPAGDVAGFCLITTIAPRVGHVVQVAVDPARQGERLGALLLQRSLDVLSRDGHELVTLSVSEGNLRASSWYQRLGFETLTTFAACHADPAADAGTPWVGSRSPSLSPP